MPVYPEDGRAKVYRLRDCPFDKVGDFEKEATPIEDLPCELTLEFIRMFSAVSA